MVKETAATPERKATASGPGMVVVERHCNHSVPMPIIITGAARGGTSFVASVCHHLGLQLGDSGPLHENWFLQQAVTANSWDLVRELAKAISVEHKQWGWKLPALGNHLVKIDELFSTHQYIFVFRNPVTISLTKRRVLQSEDLAIEILKAANLYANIASFARTCDKPTMFVSFEEARANLPAAIQAIADFCHLEVKNAVGVATGVIRDRGCYRSSPFPQPPPRNKLNDKLDAICRQHGKAFAGYPAN